MMSSKTGASKKPALEMATHGRVTRFLRSLWKRRAYKRLTIDNIEALEAGMEFNRRCTENKTKNLRRNAICEEDVIERIGIYLLLEQHLSLEYVLAFGF